MHTLSLGGDCMLVLEGNAFYEIDEECLKKKEKETDSTAKEAEKEENKKT